MNHKPSTVHRPPLTVIKIGGNILTNDAILDEVLSDFSEIEGAKILVHGGGRKASEVLKIMGIEPKMINGRRVTDAPTMEVVTMVYAGLINKNLVTKLQTKNCKSIGLTGADLNSIQAHKRIVEDVDYGFAGDIDVINSGEIKALLDVGFTPVFCSITHDNKGQLLNTNADTIASALAVALSENYEVTLRFCFEKDGVLLDVNDDDSVVEMLSKTDYENYKSTGQIYAGMIPKIDNAYNALEGGVHEVFICHAKSLNADYFDGTKLKI